MEHELPKQLTARQEAILRVIASHQQVRAVGPTLRQVAAEMGTAANAAHRHVEALRAAGRIEPEAGFGLVVVQANTLRTDRAPLAKPSGQLL